MHLGRWPDVEVARVMGHLHCEFEKMFHLLLHIYNVNKPLHFVYLKVPVFAY